MNDFRKLLESLDKINNGSDKKRTYHNSQSWRRDLSKFYPNYYIEKYRKKDDDRSWEILNAFDQMDGKIVGNWEQDVAIGYLNLPDNIKESVAHDLDMLEAQLTETELLNLSEDDGGHGMGTRSFADDQSADMHGDRTNDSGELDEDNQATQDWIAVVGKFAPEKETDISKYPPQKNMNGPYKFKNGLVLYFDPAKNQYYDLNSDTHIDNTDVLSMVASGGNSL